MNAAAHQQSHHTRSRTRIGSDDARAWVRNPTLKAKIVPLIRPEIESPADGRVNR